MKPRKKSRSSSKKQRQQQVLFALVRLFIKEGKPVGSGTLSDSDCKGISSATVRNYFVELEQQGYLTQQHSSGGRIPTAKAFREYADFCVQESKKSLIIEEVRAEQLNSLRSLSQSDIAAILEKAAELLSAWTGCASFLSSPRFDHDFVRDLKLMSIDDTRCLCVIITSFGLVKTEILRSEQKLSAFAVKRMESYFHWRLSGRDEPQDLSESELQLAQNFYNEALVRYVVGYSNFVHEEIFRTGLSKLLDFPDYDHVANLAGALQLFEDPGAMRLLLRECLTHNESRIWIGDQVPRQEMVQEKNCAVLAEPYAIGPKSAGAIGILGPMRMPYQECLEILHAVGEALTEALTNSIYRFSITYRQPLNTPPSLTHEQQLLLEDQRKRPEKP